MKVNGTAVIYSNCNVIRSSFFMISMTMYMCIQLTTAYPADGGEIYKTYCAICHKIGLNAAPKYGNKAFWGKVVKKGRDTVYTNSLNGLRGMPPRGGFVNLTDEEVQAGVDYMVRGSGGWRDSK